MQHVRAFFATREAADIATEHLIQEHGVGRPDVFLQPVGSENSAGLRASGGDSASAAPGTERRTDGALGSAIELSVDVDDAKAPEIRKALQQSGAKLSGAGPF